MARRLLEERERRTDGKLAYIAHPSGQRTTAFPLLRISDSEVVFGNPEHDFPLSRVSCD